MTWGCPTTGGSDRLPDCPCPKPLRPFCSDCPYREEVVPVLPEIEPVRAQGRVPKVQLHEQTREAKGDERA